MNSYELLISYQDSPPGVKSMIFQMYPYFYIFFICAFITGFTAYYAWNRRTIRSAKTFSVLMGCVTWWIFFYACELISAEPDVQFLFLCLEYLAIPWIPGFILWFSLEYGGYEKYCTREGLIFIFIIPVIIFVSFFTNGIFEIYYENFTYITYENLTVPSWNPGIMYRVLNISFVIPQLFLFFIFYKAFRKSSRIFRTQIAVLLISIITALVSLLFFFLLAKPYPNFDLQPIFLAIISMLILTAIFRFRFFDLINIPYHSIFENLEEGIIVLDGQTRIIQVNRKASEMLDINQERVLGEKLDSIGSFISPYYDELTGDSYTSIRMENGIKNGNLSLLIDMYPIFNSSNHLQNRMIILRDISEIVRSSQALSKAGEKLNLLNSITRHDILNQIAIISGYGSLLTDCVSDDSVCRKQLDAINSASDSVKHLIQFTATYQDLGVSKPVWLSIRDVVVKSWNTLHPPDSVSLQVDTDLVVFADMLLEKVFYNLMDNSLRHGSSVTRISISDIRTEDGYRVVYEDDGVGIAPENKEKIFSRGFGKNTGYGLFLVREILSITSIAIHETGSWGSGVRFEISIPPGGVKIPQEDR